MPGDRGLVNTYGTFQSYYRSHLLVNTDPALISLIGGTQSFCILFASFITGRLLDSGHHRQLGATGGILATLGMFMLSISSGPGAKGDGRYWAIWLTQGLTVGLGMSCMFVYSSQVVSSWFVRRRGLAIGITASGASIGTSVCILCYQGKGSKAHISLSWLNLSHHVQVYRGKRWVPECGPLPGDIGWWYLLHSIPLCDTESHPGPSRPTELARVRCLGR